MSTSDEVADVLRQHGHRATASRKAVYGVLASGRGHLTAEQVAELVPGDVSIATVYRALAILEDLDLARSVRLDGDGPSWWELAHSDDHAHLVCIRCGTVDHHVGSAVEQLRRHLDDDHGFLASRVEFVVSGTCATCRRIAGHVEPTSGSVSL